MNIKQKFVSGLTAASMAVSLFAPFAAFAAPAPVFGEGSKSQQLLGVVGDNAGISSQKKLPEVIGSVINVALSMLGLVFLGLALYAGFKWMTAQGDSKAVDEAQGTLKNAVIGMIIVAASYALSTFVMGQLLTITQ
jgi:hypothetical protein